MRTIAPVSLPLFRSDLQARLLALLFLQPDRRFTSRDLRSATGGSPASLHRELARLENAGLVEVERAGRTKLHGAAMSSPLFEPMRTLIERTLGIEEALRTRLGSVDGVHAAAIFGSVAAGRISPTSDIDVLVIGNALLSDVYEAVAEVERLVGREIAVRAYDRTEFEQRLAEGSGFLTTVLGRPMTALVGSIPGRPA